MKKKLLPSFLTLLTLFNFSCDNPNRELDTFVTTTCQQAMDTSFTADAKGMMVVGTFLSSQDTVTFDKVYYFSNGDNPLPTANTLFMIGSVTKTFTTAMLAQKVVEGSIDLSVPAQNYLPPINDEAFKGPVLPTTFNGAPVTITLAHLGSHTSGLQRNLPKVAENTLPDNMPGFTKGRIPYLHGFNSLTRDTLLFAPGSNNSYSNTGIALIGIVLTYQAYPNNPTYYNSYNGLLTSNLLFPMGMHNTSLNPDFREIVNAAIPYGTDGTEVNYGASTLPFNSASGGLYSTIADMMIYGKEVVGEGHVLTQAVRDTLFARRFAYPPGTSKWTTLGWTEKRNLRDSLNTRHSRYVKSGEVSGFNAYINIATPNWNLEDKKLFVIVMVNRREMPLSEITDAIMNKMLELD